MKSYSAHHIFTPDEIKVWRMATELVEGLPENQELRCHELARAVALYLHCERPQLLVCDGKFGLAEHSWLVVTTPGRHVILDVYTVASLPMVQLIDAGSLAVREARRYAEGTCRDDVNERAVRALLVSMSQRR